MNFNDGITTPITDARALYREFVETLRQAAAAYFAEKGAPIDSRREYCLQSPDLWSRNIICSDVVSYIRGEYPHCELQKPPRLHESIHNGLSSQAMLFNLIGPLIVRNDLAPLRSVLARKGVLWPEGNVRAEFEYDDRKVFNETAQHPTSFDAAIIGDTTPVFIEAKLKETEFGGCGAYPVKCDGRNRAAADYSRCYLYRKGRRYWELMYEHGVVDEKMAAEPQCPFVENYQFYREFLFALAKDGSYVLLCDERNVIFAGADSENVSNIGLWARLRNTLPEFHRKRLALITVQQVVGEIRATGRHDDWIGDFVRKYGMSEGCD